ncbi:hypothetical protein RF11_13461 [Thelohanellus kitauei]|uniref:Uncharacterized protein n=1 Tax=Thelohanellus kitauei TaxID=669202 RepID=A0A0C2MIT1_THEKT|nr:hypothetical protein RF11_13461 [Thelohanellus kitauei]
MANLFSTFLFIFLEALIFASCGIFGFIMFVPSLFEICIYPPKGKSCAFFGVFNIIYNDEKLSYGETTVLFMALRALVLICAVLVPLSAFATIRGYTLKKGKVLFVYITFLTMTALILLSIVYTVQWFQLILSGSSFLEPFPFHDLRPISKNLSFPFIMATLYQMIPVYFFIGILIASTTEEDD